MDFLVTFPTHDERFAPSCCHVFDPDWLCSSSWLFQISELAKVMDLSFLCRAAEVTCVCTDPLKAFAPVGHDALREAITKDGFWFSLERDTSKAGHQWFLVLATPDHHLQACLRSICRFHGSLVSLCHVGDGGSLFPCQCLEECCFCSPMPFVKPGHLVREERGWNHPSVFRLRRTEKAVVTLTTQGCPLSWLASVPVHRPCVFNACLGHS